MVSKTNLEKKVVCIVGLGYVGLPLAINFSKNFKTIGFDIDKEKVRKLKKTYKNFEITSNPAAIKNADFIISAVPTPVTKNKDPDLSLVISSAKIIGKNMKKGAIIVSESTVYPGVTEEVIGPILEQESKMVLGKDFKIGYSPERVNPGDDEHVIEKITKIVSGMDKETAELLSKLYGKITKTYIAEDIRTAETAKVIENVQRDLNIALMNELSIIFSKMGLNTTSVLNAAATKWNFHRYKPGMVGGHCIPVDPYYLVFKAKELGYHPRVILSGRGINDYMPEHVANITIRGLIDSDKIIKKSNVLIMGLTYKENVPDTRETPVKTLIRELKGYGVNVYGFDPLLEDAYINDEFKIDTYSDINKIKSVDAIILATGHDIFKNVTLKKLSDISNKKPLLVDVRNFYDKKEAVKKGFIYRSL